ncbi:MAG: hypothetical protein C0404_10150 [Verrucomicrobia bacterium]|nr:hypothetical protein [Verrucomicrobiota bacterium]
MRIRTQIAEMRQDGYSPARRTAAAVAAFVACMLPMAAFAQGTAQLSARVDIDHDRTYVHDTLNLTISVFGNGIRLGRSIRIDDLPGKDLFRYGEFKELQPSRAVVGGRLTESRHFTCTAIPLTEGTFKIQPSLHVGVMEPDLAFFGDPFRERAVQMTPPATNVLVAPLPQKDRPANFSGAVGQFDFALDISPTDVAVGSLITATMKVAGNGYLDDIVPPASSPGRDFKVYEPRKISEKPGQELVFQQIIIPQSTNAAMLPAFSFSFFNPRAEKYQTLTRGPTRLVFHPPKTIDHQPASFTNVQRTATTRTNLVTSQPVSSPLSNREAFELIRKEPAKDPWTWISLLLLLAIALVLFTGPRLYARSGKRVLARLAAVAFITLLLAGLGAGLFHSVSRVLFSGATATVVRAGKVRFAPSELALESFELAAGTKVYVQTVHGGWAKIAANGKRGWAPISSLTRSR